jgi:hypothetical protein
MVTDLLTRQSQRRLRASPGHLLIPFSHVAKQAGLKEAKKVTF